MSQLFRRKIYSESDTSTNLLRVLGVWDIVFFGIAAIIGAGSFSSLGEAVFRGGPGVILLYLICGFACGLQLFAMQNLPAEFRQQVLLILMPMPVSGN
jgi:L-asparagine transporter-like permease